MNNEIQRLGNNLKKILLKNPNENVINSKEEIRINNTENNEDNK